MFKKPLVTPLINLNGDDPQKLIDDLMHIRVTLFRAMGVMRAAGPHGRNYQTMPQPQAILAEARAAWDERVQTLLNLYAEIGDLAEMISRQTLPPPINGDGDKPTIQ